MTRKLRLRNSAGLWLLVITSAVGVGCSSTSRSRFRVAEGSRSVASIGDRTLSTSVGASGSQVLADLPNPEPYRDPKARISGRVVDSQGRAISGATVRLADGMSKAGRDVQTITDRSGGFTLGNLRPGSSYQLVAEADFGDNTTPLFGRAEADTAEHGVQIRLADGTENAGSPEDTGARSRSPSAKTRSISERRDGNLTTTSPNRVNSEDLDPPADSADLVPDSRSDSSENTDTGQPDNSSSASDSNWRRPGLKSDSLPGSARGTRSDTNEPPAIDTTPDEPLDLDFDPGVGRRRPVSSLREAELNPLPPALPARDRDTKNSGSIRTRPVSQVDTLPRARQVVPAPTEEAAVGGSISSVDPLFVDSEPESEFASAASDNSGSLLAMPSPATMEIAENSALAQAPRRLDLNRASPRTDPPPEANSVDPDPTVTAINPTSSTPGDPVFEPNPGGLSLPDISPASTPTKKDPSANYNPFALVAALRPSGSKVFPESLPENKAIIPPLPEQDGNLKSMDDIFSTPPPVAEAAEVEASEPPKVKKWGDVAGSSKGAAVSLAASGSAMNVSHTDRAGNFLSRRGRSAASTSQPDAPALCQFNAQTGQLIDFQLPDLDGQVVRLRDLDADFILFDFWGTWCKPCTDSIPHLVELQKKYGPSKLKIVGVACEKTTPEKRKVLVADAAQKLGINYPVLLASMDGTCPVQRDFQVQFYPTMVLVDRRGKILFRAEGATERNMYRLDQALAAAQKPMQTARR